MSEEAIQASFRRIERREWHLWLAVILITLLLTAGLASFLLPALRTYEDTFYRFSLPLAVRALLGLVLLFDVYTIYQQLQIHRIRRQLNEREELFRLISENAADMIAVVNVDGRRIYNSLSYEKVLGYSLAELNDSPSLEQIHPEDQARVKEAADIALRTGVGQSLEYRIRHKNGTWRVLESTASVIRNSEGMPEKLVIVNRDITERKQAADALRRSEINFRSVVEDAPYGIYRASPTGQLLLVNPALQKMLGYDSHTELFQANLATDIYGDPDEHQGLNDFFLLEGAFKETEVGWRRKDRTPIRVRCTGRPVKDESGNLAYFEVFAEDVTEKRALERQLQMAQKMEAVGRLSGGIAHDFNNLLGVIIGYSQVLKRALGQESPLREHAEEVEKAGQRAASLTRQLLAFSRQQVLEPSILDINTLVLDTEKMLRRLIGEDIALTTKLDPLLGRVKADPSQIEQIIMNLAVNARDAMPEGGKLAVETANIVFDLAYTRQHPGSRPGAYVMLAVNDTGTGMDAETQSHIFEPFFTTKERGKGTGLGLATVYGVVKQSGGYIWVDSEVGKGTSFKIYLPRIEEAPIPAEPISTSYELRRGSETILLVEDADPLRKLTCQFLAASGYQVLTAASAEEALKTAAEHGKRIQLLLTDVVMSGMNGRMLAENLASLQPWIRVLYMSGYTDSAIAGHGVLESGTYLLHKPFTEEALLRKVREVLDSKTVPKQPPVTTGSILGSDRLKQ